MATYDSFEELPVWQGARQLAVMVYRTTSKGKLREDYGLKNQMQRAGVSVSSNIAEGFERGSKREFIQSLYIAKGSCGELRSQLFIANDVGYMTARDFESLLCSVADVSKQIAGFIEYLKVTKYKGQKFKSPQS